MIFLMIQLLATIFFALWIEPAGAHSLINVISLKKKKHPGVELEVWLKHFKGRSSHLFSSSGPINLPHYKFYTEIIEIILSFSRRIGSGFQDSFLSLREGLLEDLQFESKIKSMTYGVYGQMVFISVVTWVFIFMGLHLTEVKMNYLYLLSILSWQVIGFSILPIILKFLRRKYFNDLGLVWKILMILKSLTKVPLPRGEVFKLSGVKELSKVRQKNLLHLSDKIKESCEKTLKTGLSYENDINFLFKELRFQENFSFTVLEKKNGNT